MCVSRRSLQDNDESLCEPFNKKEEALAARAQVHLANRMYRWRRARWPAYIFVRSDWENLILCQSRIIRLIRYPATRDFLLQRDWRYSICSGDSLDPWPILSLIKKFSVVIFWLLIADGSSILKFWTKNLGFKTNKPKRLSFWKRERERNLISEKSWS